MIHINKKIGVSNPQFTVTGYRNAYRQWKQGTYRDLIAMMQQAEIDSYVAGCLAGRQAGVMRTWSIEPWEEGAKAEQRAADLMAAMKQLNMRELFKGILDARGKIFRVIDFEWGMVNGLQFPTAFTALQQKYFRYDPKDGVLKIDFGNRLEDIPDEALVVEYKEKPFMLPVLRDYILKEFGIEAWADFIELFGHPVIIGKYPAGADKDLKEELDTAVKAIARASRGAMPDTAEIELIETGKTTGDHQDFTNAANKGMAIAILGHANAVEDSSGMKIGENITGFQAKKDVSLDDLYFIDEQVNKFLRFVQRQNWGDGNFCLFKTEKADPPNQAELRENIDVAYNHGVRLHISNYQALGLRVSDEEEWVQKQELDFGL